MSSLQDSVPKATTSSNAASIVKAKTKPPPEAPYARARRRYVLLSFWMLILFIGIPFWWKTTNVYRAPLPYETMDSWAEGKVCDTLKLGRPRLTNLGLRILSASKSCSRCRPPPEHDYAACRPNCTELPRREQSNSHASDSLVGNI